MQKEYRFSELNVSAEDFRQKAFHWANNFPQVAFYTNNGIPYLYNGFENLLAISTQISKPIQPAEAFSYLETIANSEKFWCGILNYDLKNQVENLSSHHQDYIGFPTVHFFQPEIYFTFQPQSVTVFSEIQEGGELIKAILQTEIPVNNPDKITWQSRVSKTDYLENVKRLQDHILEGDVYELNYCMEFFAENATVFPPALFEKLNVRSPMPFAGFFKFQDTYLMCASPERFLKKESRKLIAQPIKGTIKRGGNSEEDAALQDQLLHDEKERAENLMIVDLMRNDLSRSAETGSIQVEELFGIYGFQHVSQMISTITATVRKEENLASILKNTFPMGSMTGAPKIRAMQLIEQFENHRRGLYSGSLGYLKPNGDFDFNVVIRSLQYNAQTKYLSYMVGSAITIDSVPENEYGECLLKAKAIMEVC